MNTSLVSNSSGDIKNGFYINPILKGNYADPSIIRVDDNYYMVNTSYKYLPGLIIWHSKDLVNWQPISTALDKLVGDVWAPEFVYYEDMYYIYFPANKTNWVVTAKDPKGPWSEPINLNTKYIDPGHVVGPDNKRYLHLSGGHMVQLSDDGLSIVGEIQKVYEPWKYPDDWEVEAFSPEGPKLTYRTGYYYMTIAVGGTAGPPTSHMVASSRSKTPWGPWEHSPYNPIIKTSSKEERWWSQGHGTLVDTLLGEWWMIFHAYESGFQTLGRQTLLLPIEWTEGGWYKVPNGISVEQAIKKPLGESLSHGLPIKDNFEGEKVGYQWQTYGEVNRERFEVANRSLTITGHNENNVAPLLYMALDKAYEVEIDVSVEENVEGKFMLYYNETAFLGLSVTTEGIQHFRTFKKYKVIPYEGKTVRLKIKNNHHIISFYYLDKIGRWKKYDKVLEASGFHHNTLGGFLSLRIGLEAIGEGKATFKNFEYRQL
ncbi:xylan 1,4-beta-xylosidase [Anaerobacillus alkalilacustris]|uniref:Xylan 1,4-beta-xylosidase n=1 Tax=Anaerobacillus alkalilacustris TaxID=393763 RepID=A0A1S2LQ91_9BACI|nr:family 43 glycosylhydrolase [Anaerobacillus alkalilacustris]OIJ14671.1 xylan 1,4-beta-xylosidase [Anaerobacillus alkalilacustris]